MDNLPFVFQTSRHGRQEIDGGGRGSGAGQPGHQPPGRAEYPRRLWKQSHLSVLGSIFISVFFVFFFSFYYFSLAVSQKEPSTSGFQNPLVRLHQRCQTYWPDVAHRAICHNPPCGVRVGPLAACTSTQRGGSLGCCLQSAPWAPPCHMQHWVQPAHSWQRTPHVAPRGWPVLSAVAQAAPGAATAPQGVGPSPGHRPAQGCSSSTQGQVSFTPLISTLLN